MTSNCVGSLIKFLLELGVEEVVSCPGGRSASILNEILKNKKIKVETLYDERAAGFYALGKTIKTQKPVVVLTTSGSAATALYPALLEAKHQEGARLIALTADRPSEFAGSGAPQTIVQKNLFKTNKVESIQFDNVEDLKEHTKELNYPVHINVPLKDPSPLVEVESVAAYESLLIISSLKEAEKDEVKNALSDYSGALVLESLSNLSEKDFSKAQIIKFGEDFLLKMGLKSFKKVYRVGGVPILKSWREAHRHKTVYFWNQYKFSGTLNAQGKTLENLSQELSKTGFNRDLQQKIQEHRGGVEALIEKHPSSEVACLKKVSKLIPDGARVFIGNSMPIREWEFVNWSRFSNFGQRGVNGIDGSVALALGSLDSEKENWIVLGDLTSLYNIGDFQVLKYLKQYNIKFLVVNNSGGRIFEKIFKENTEFFVNKRTLSFKALAGFWNIEHIKLRDDFKLPEKLPKQVLLELETAPEKSLDFWTDLSGVCL